MDTIRPEVKMYLFELFQKTEGDSAAQVSMFEVGAALGLAKEDAGKMAETLIGEGLAEVKTLSGGIGITASGIETVQAAGGAGAADTAVAGLGTGPVLVDKGRAAAVSICAEIKAHIAQSKAPYEHLEEMVMDLKCIDVQLLSPRPKTAIVREALRALQDTLKASGGGVISDKIAKIIST